MGLLLFSAFFFVPVFRFVAAVEFVVVIFFVFFDWSEMIFAARRNLDWGTAYRQARTYGRDEKWDMGYVLTVGILH